ncbi:MAG: hypothetical protein H6684_15840 [Deltaproteobacteria bacterium]|nr:hypothetical protein [Deltaproteobacteria bacterium]MCB9490202.1 hypothetical protein [Deltaproteobacteria bacterium]
MCGVAAIFERTGAPADEASLRRLGDGIRHRGPDDSGIALDGPAGLMSYRFALEDIEHGRQPARFGAWTVAWNGEIFNWREVAAAFDLSDVTGDTTLLPRLLAAKDIDAFAELDGQFGIAAWDASTRRLILARDPAGILPMHYHLTSRLVAAASELRALARWLPGTTYDDAAMSRFLRLGYWQPPDTPLVEIRQLEPGAMLVVNETATAHRRFYRPAPNPTFTGSVEDAGVRLAELMVDATARRISTAAPTGLFLSGGVDSALIAASLKKIGRDLPAYCVGFEGTAPTAGYHFEDGFEKSIEQYNEFAEAAETAKCLRMHPPTKVRADELMLIDELGAVVDTLDEPCMSISAPPLYLLTKDASRTIRVALSGGGADELFAGYAHVDPTRYANAPSVVRRYLELTEVFTPDEMERIGAASVEPARDLSRTLPEGVANAADVGLSPLSFILIAERLGPLAHNILHKNDRIGMHWPLEMRYPFLDRRIIDFAESLPDDLQTGPDGGKAVVKAAARHLGLPASVTDRKKIRLQAPYATYLSDARVEAFFERVIAHETDDRPRLFDPQRARDYLFGPMSAKVWRRPAKILLLATWNLWRP